MDKLSLQGKRLSKIVMNNFVEKEMEQILFYNTNVFIPRTKLLLPR